MSGKKGDRLNTMHDRDEIAHIIQKHESDRWDRLPQSPNVEYRVEGKEYPTRLEHVPEDIGDPFGLLQGVDKYLLDRKFEEADMTPMPLRNPRRK